MEVTDITGFERARRSRKQAEEVEDRGRQAKEVDTEGPETEAELAGLEEKTVRELRKEASEAGVKNYGHMKKTELVEALKAVM